MEIWDANDSKLNKIDVVTLVRGEQIPDGYFHLCSEIIVRHTVGTYLINMVKNSIHGVLQLNSKQ